MKQTIPTVTHVRVTPAAGAGGTRFDAAVTAIGMTPLRTTYQWKLDGEEILGSTGASHVASEGGLLTVVATVTNDSGARSRESKAVKVAVGVEASSVSEARIAPATGTVGDVFCVIVEVDGVPGPALSYQWKIDGREIPGADRNWYEASSEGAISVVVTAINTEGGDSLESAPVTVSQALSAPTVLSVGIAPVSGQAGDLFTASNAVDGAPDPTISYQWTLDGAPVPGATASAFASVVAGALGVTVVATNSQGSDSMKSAAVKVVSAQFAPFNEISPSISGSGRVGSSQSVAPGTWAGNPAPDIAFQWRRDGADIAGATGQTFTPRPEDDSHDISCVVVATNALGDAAVESPTVPISHEPPIVIDVLDDVAFIQDSGDGVVDASRVFAGTDLSFSATGADLEIDLASGILVVDTAKARVASTVVVTARNSGGAASASFELTVEPELAAPAINGAAISPSTGRVGDVFSVSYGVVGYPAPSVSYQWKLGGAAIPGATSSSRLSANEGPLSVLITAMNDLGTASVETAPVMVAAPLSAPVVMNALITPDNGEIGQAFTASHMAAGVPDPTVSYQWSIDGVSISEATAATFAPDTPGALRVTVMATNSQGSNSMQSAPALIVSASVTPYIGPYEDLSFSAGTGIHTVDMSAVSSGDLETWSIDPFFLRPFPDLNVASGSDGSYDVSRLACGTHSRTYALTGQNPTFVTDADPVNGFLDLDLPVGYSMEPDGMIRISHTAAPRLKEAYTVWAWTEKAAVSQSIMISNESAASTSVEAGILQMTIQSLSVPSPLLAKPGVLSATIEGA